jgi:hypothetical protein
VKLWLRVLAVLVLMPAASDGQLRVSAAELGASLRDLALDPDACFRVRELSLQREDARIYFTDGWLIFTKPVHGERLGMMFSGMETGNDAEILLRPPDRSERASLARWTGSPNMDEHFKNAAFLSTDGAAAELMAQIEAASPRRNPEMGLILAGRHNALLRNLSTSFQVRLVLDLLKGDKQAGIFYGAFAGNTLKNFDVMFDPTAAEQIVVGEVSSAGNAPGFNIWTSFTTRKRRADHAAAVEELKLSRFTIDAVLELDLSLAVTTKARYRAAKQVRGAVGFEIAPEMEIREVLWNGRPVEFYRKESLRDNLIGQRRNDQFLVVLPEPLPPGSEGEFLFRHAGKVIREAGNGVYYVAARTNWYPNRGLNFAAYDVTFRVPRHLTVVATGDIVEEREEADSRISRRRTSSPVRMAGFNIGEYESVRAKRGDLEVVVFSNRRAEPGLQRRQAQAILLPPAFPSRSMARRPGELVLIPAVPADPRARLDSLAADVATEFEWMAAQFGQPPLKLLTVSPIPGNFGQGFAGLIYMSTMAYLPQSDRAVSGSATQVFYDEILHAHETAHQWWGNLVTCESYRDEWIQEALANYSALMMLEKKKGVKALSEVLADFRSNLRVKLPEAKNGSPAHLEGPIESAGPVTWGIRLHTETGPDPWRSIVYDKGAWILHMLRRRVGDASFLRMLGEIRRTYAYKAITTEDLRAVAASFSPKDAPDPRLENFFDNWVYSTGLPTLSLTTRMKGKAPNLQLTITVRQSEVHESFAVDVPVEIRLPGTAKPLVRWVRTSNEPESITVPLRAAPAKVELAPGNAVLAFVK